MNTNSQVSNPELIKGHWIIDGTGWHFKAVLYDTTSIKHKNIYLNAENVCLFEYTNQWNALVLTAQMVYKDVGRDLGRLFRIPHLIMKVEWAENKAEKKKEIKQSNLGEMENAGDFWVEKPIKKEDYFNHPFLVNKMEIVSHDTKTDVTTYKFELISATWYKLSAVCQYSNYNLKKPEPITKIICRLLVNAVGIDKVATKTFLEDPCKTDICIYYTTQQHDNYFSAIHYLLNRMYMEPSSFDVDNHPRIILWDEKERKYRLAKFNEDKTCLRAKHNTIQMNRFYEISDNEVNPYQPGHGGPMDFKPTITAVTKMPYTRFIKNFYTRHYWDLNITKDKFVRKIIMNEKIQNTFKSPSACPKRDCTFYPNPDITSEEDCPDLQQFLTAKKLYLIDECKWNNQRHMYNDCIQGVVNKDSIIFTRTNKVNHQPWQCFYLIRRPDEMKEKEMIDTDSLKPDEPIDPEDKGEKKEKTKPNKFVENSFFGPWYVYKSTHSIIINGSKKGYTPDMTERLQLVRPFEIAPVPKEIRR